MSGFGAIVTVVHDEFWGVGACGGYGLGGRGD